MGRIVGDPGNGVWEVGRPLQPEQVSSSESYLGTAIWEVTNSGRRGLLATLIGCLREAHGRHVESGSEPETGISLECFSCLPGMEARFWRGLANSVKARARVAATFQVGLDRVCARATLPLSGAGRVL